MTAILFQVKIQGQRKGETKYCLRDHKILQFFGFFPFHINLLGERYVHVRDIRN